MDAEFRDRFVDRWRRHFGASELPIVFFFADDPGDAEEGRSHGQHRCVFADLNRVRQGTTVAFDAPSIGCFGGKKYLGFSQDLRPGFEYFLSCGIPGGMEGERYKKSPAMVLEMMKRAPSFVAPKSWIVFKRWDSMGPDDRPEVVVFFATPDTLAGLFTLANFDEVEQDGVIAPSCSGCSSIVMQPYLQRTEERPRAVLGLFDPSARPFVGPDILTLAVPMQKFERMAANVDESFLITDTWEMMAKRLSK